MTARAARLALCLAISLGLAQSSYRVVRVVDGDTVVLESLGTVRLIGVDTPETVDPRKPVEAFGKEASAFLLALLKGQAVRVEYDQARTDKYGRTLAYLYLADGTFVNRKIVEAGFGYAYTEFPFKYLDEFRAAERGARAQKRGLWADAIPVSTSNPIVLVNRKGSVYHRPKCRELVAGFYPVPMSDLPVKLTPCKVCKPPAR
jgi:micrococcal nuclease